MNKTLDSEMLGQTLSIRSFTVLFFIQVQRDYDFETWKRGSL